MPPVLGQRYGISVGYAIPYSVDYHRLNIDSLLDLWCAGEVNQIIWKFNQFCQ